MRIALIGGSLRLESVSARVLHTCARLVSARGAIPTVLTAADLALPLYEPGVTARTPQACKLIETLRSADGIVLATPTYHGGMSGLMKNVLDYTEDLAADSYLDGRAAGCVAVGWSEHGAATAIADLRNSVQSLRAWATPMGVTINSAAMDEFDARTTRRLDIMLGQVLDFAALRTSALVS